MIPMPEDKPVEAPIATENPDEEPRGVGGLGKAMTDPTPSKDNKK